MKHNARIDGAGFAEGGFGRAREGFLMHPSSALGGIVSFRASQGGSVEERTGPFFTITPSHMMETSSGDIVDVETEDWAVDCALTAIERRRRTGASELEVVWRLELRDRSWFALTEDPQGDIVVGGSARTPEPPFRCMPMIGVVSADGQLLTEWTPPSSTVTGEVLALAFDSSGDLYAAGAEDSVSGDRDSSLALECQ